MFLLAASAAVAVAGCGSGTQTTLVQSPHCRSGQLRLAQPRFNGAYTGHSVEDVAFRNLSGATCTLRGWPTLAVVLQDGRKIALGAEHIPNRTSTGSLAARTVVVRSGAAASFNLVAPDFDPSRNMGPWPCVGSSFLLLVTPPGTRTPLRIHQAHPYCGPLIKRRYFVTPLVAGRVDHHMAG